MKIVVLDGYTLNPGDLSWDGLKKQGELTVYDRTEYNNDQIIKAIDGAAIVFTNKTPLSREVLEEVPSVHYIGLLATGYNVVDVNAARELGITVTNVPNYGTTAVAQMTLALLLEMCNQVGHHNRAVKQGDWTKSKDFCFWDFPLIELEGKTMGIIGFGRIGRAVAKLAQAFGMNILALARSARPESETGICAYVDLEELLMRSDVISLHCPLTAETEGIINENSISKMKDGAMIINTSRGPLVVESHLKDALDRGKLAAAAVDVVSVEPITEDNPLLKADRCIITPHIAWASKEARARLLHTAIGNLEAFLKGDPVNVVNP